MTQSQTQDKLKYHHGNLRQALLSHAFDVIAQKGSAKLTLRELARRAGVSHTAPYRHFASKTDLLGSVAAEAFRDFRTFLETKMEQQEDALQRLEALCIGYVFFAVQHPDRFSLMFDPELPKKSVHEELQKTSMDSFQLLLDAVIQCQKVGVLRAANPEDFALTAWSMSHGLAVLYSEDQLLVKYDEDLEKIVRRAAHNLYRGLGASHDD